MLGNHFRIYVIWSLGNTTNLLVYFIIYATFPYIFTIYYSDLFYAIFHAAHRRRILPWGKTSCHHGHLQLYICRHDNTTTSCIPAWSTIRKLYTQFTCTYTQCISVYNTSCRSCKVYTDSFFSYVLCIQESGRMYINWGNCRMFTKIHYLINCQVTNQSSWIS